MASFYSIPGPAGTVQIGSVSTLAPNTSATVTNSGSAEAAVLDFGIPAGTAGATGTAGSRFLSEIEAMTLYGSSSIGTPGALLFGVGSMPPPSGDFAGLGYASYTPVHAASGSLM